MHSGSAPDGVLRLPDGRRAQLWDGGAPDGAAVFFLHGCPDTRHAAYAGDESARRIGVRLIAINRPGYGGSDAAASTHQSVADDIAAVADQLAIERYAVLGMSLGGPYALACAVRHPDRVTAVGVAASPANVPELDPPVHRDDLGPEERAFFARLSTLSPDAAAESMRADFEAYTTQLNPSDPDDSALARRFLAQLDPDDTKLMGSNSAIAASVREALANPDGYLRDAAISFRTWDFRVDQIRCPTYLWYGELDRNVSPRNGPWLVDRIPKATLRIHEQATHLAVLHEHWDEILATLSGRK